MYHDEFAAGNVAARVPGVGVEGRLACLAIEAGGGITLAIAAEMIAGALLPAVYDLAAMIPLVAASASILARRGLGLVGHRVGAAIPVQSRAYRGPSRRPGWAGARTPARAGRRSADSR